jgi:hypothetical protein
MRFTRNGLPEAGKRAVVAAVAALAVALVGSAAQPAEAAVIWQSQTRTAQYVSHQEPTQYGYSLGNQPSDFYSTNASASGFAPFSVTSGALGTYYGASQVSSFGATSFHAEGHAKGVLASRPGLQWSYRNWEISHFEVIFSLTEAMNYQLVSGARPVGAMQPVFTDNAQLIGPTGAGSQTLNFITAATSTSTYTGTLAAGQYKFVEDASSWGYYDSGGGPNEIYLLDFTMTKVPEPSTFAAIMLTTATGALTTRRCVSRRRSPIA